MALGESPDHNNAANARDESQAQGNNGASTNSSPASGQRNPFANAGAHLPGRPGGNASSAAPFTFTGVGAASPAAPFTFSAAPRNDSASELANLVSLPGVALSHVNPSTLRALAKLAQPPPSTPAPRKNPGTPQAPAHDPTGAQHGIASRPSSTEDSIAKPSSPTSTAPVLYSHRKSRVIEAAAASPATGTASDSDGELEQMPAAHTVLQDSTESQDVELGGNMSLDEPGTPLNGLSVDRPLRRDRVQFATASSSGSLELGTPRPGRGFRGHHDDASFISSQPSCVEALSGIPVGSSLHKKGHIALLFAKRALSFSAATVRHAVRQLCSLTLTDCIHGIASVFLTIMLSPFYLFAAGFVFCTLFRAAKLAEKLRDVSVYAIASLAAAISIAESSPWQDDSALQSRFPWARSTLAGSSPSRLTVLCQVARSGPSASYTATDALCTEAGKKGDGVTVTTRDYPGLARLPHLSADTSLTLLKRAILWEFLKTLRDLTIIAAGTVVVAIRVVQSPAEVALRHIWEQRNYAAVELVYNARKSDGARSARAGDGERQSGHAQATSGHVTDTVHRSGHSTLPRGSNATSTVLGTQRGVQGPAGGRAKQRFGAFGTGMSFSARTLKGRIPGAPDNSVRGTTHSQRTAATSAGAAPKGAPSITEPRTRFIDQLDRKRSFVRILIMLPPDVVILFYVYFLGIIYITVAALWTVFYEQPEASGRSPMLFLYPFEWLLRGLGLSKTTVLQNLGEDFHETMTVLIGLFMVGIGLPIIALISITATNPTSSTIVRPRQYMRPTISNALVLTATLAEAFQLSATTFQVKTPAPESVKQVFRLFVLDLGKSTFMMGTWVVVALVFIWASFVGAGLQALDRFNPTQKSGVEHVNARDGHLYVLAQGIHQIMTGPLFLITVSRLTAVLDCTPAPDDVQVAIDAPAVLDGSLEYNADREPVWDLDESDSWIVCYSGTHSRQMTAAVLGLLFFFPSATIAAAYFEDFVTSKRDARTVPVFLQIDRIVKCFAIVVSELCSSMPFIYLPCLLLADTALLILNALFSPCCVSHINVIKNVAYGGAAWSVLISLLAAMLQGVQFPAEAFVLILIAGPCLIVGLYLLVTRQKVPDAALSEKARERAVAARMHRLASAAIAGNTPPRSWHESMRTLLGLLRTPLRERIHLERLVFMCSDHVATSPGLVADVLFKVGIHCRSSVAQQPARAAKFMQKFLRAGALGPLCALLALPLPQHHLANRQDLTTLARHSSTNARVAAYSGTFVFPPMASRITVRERKIICAKAATTLEHLMMCAYKGMDGIWAEVVDELVAYRGGLTVHLLGLVLAYFAKEQATEFRGQTAEFRAEDLVDSARNHFFEHEAAGGAMAAMQNSSTYLRQGSLGANLFRRRGSTVGDSKLRGILSQRIQLDVAFPAGARPVNECIEAYGVDRSMPGTARSAAVAEWTERGSDGPLLHGIYAQGAADGHPSSIDSEISSDALEAQEGLVHEVVKEPARVGLFSVAMCLAYISDARRDNMRELVTHGVLAATLTAVDDLLGKDIYQISGQMLWTRTRTNLEPEVTAVDSTKQLLRSGERSSLLTGQPPEASQNRRSSVRVSTTMPFAGAPLDTAAKSGSRDTDECSPTSGAGSAGLSASLGLGAETSLVSVASDNPRASMTRVRCEDRASTLLANVEWLAAEHRPTAFSAAAAGASTHAEAASGIAAARGSKPRVPFRQGGSTARTSWMAAARALSLVTAQTDLQAAQMGPSDATPVTIDKFLSLPERAEAGGLLTAEPGTAPSVEAVSSRVSVMSRPSVARLSQATMCRAADTTADRPLNSSKARWFAAVASMKKDIEVRRSTRGSGTCVMEAPGEAPQGECSTAATQSAVAKHPFSGGAERAVGGQDGSGAGAAVGEAHSDAGADDEALIRPSQGQHDLSLKVEPLAIPMLDSVDAPGAPPTPFGPFSPLTTPMAARPKAQSPSSPWLSKDARPYAAQSLRRGPSVTESDEGDNKMHEAAELLVVLLGELLSDSKSGAMERLTHLVNTDTWNVDVDEVMPDEVPKKAGWLGSLQKYLASKVQGALHHLETFYNAVESVLAIGMLKCLKPLGVREVVDVYMSCPLVKRVVPDVDACCRAMPHIVAQIYQDAPNASELPHLDQFLRHLVRRAHMEASQSAQAMSARAQQQQKQRANDGTGTLAVCGAQQGGGTTAEQGLGAGQTAGSQASQPDVWADDTVLHRLRASIRCGRDIATAAAVHALAVMYPRVREILINGIHTDAWADEEDEAGRGQNLALSGIAICLEMDLMMDTSWPVFQVTASNAARDFVASGLLEAIKAALTKFQGHLQLRSLQALVLVVYHHAMHVRFFEEGMLEAVVLTLEGATRELSRYSPTGALCHKTKGETPYAGASEHTAQSSRHSEASAGASENTSKLGMTRRGGGGRLSEAASSVTLELSRQAGTPGGLTAGASHTHASVVVACLELVALLCERIASSGAVLQHMMLLEGTAQQTTYSEVRPQLLSQVLRPSAFKLLLQTPALQHHSPIYNCTVQQSAAALLQVWALKARDVAERIQQSEFLLCKLLVAFLPVAFAVPRGKTGLDSENEWLLEGEVADVTTRARIESALNQLSETMSEKSDDIQLQDVDSVPLYFALLCQVFTHQVAWSDITARRLHPPVAQYASEWQLLDILMSWNWDEVILSRAGMGVVQAKSLGNALAMAVARRTPPMRVRCNGDIITSQFAAGALINAGLRSLGTEDAVLLSGYLELPAPIGVMTVTGQLTKLDLLNNSNIGDTGIAALAESLYHNDTLLDLNLAGIKIGEAGCDSIVGTLIENTTLRRLDLSWNELDRKCMSVLARGLAGNNTLTDISVGDPLTLPPDDSVDSLTEILSRARPALTNLTFSYVTVSGLEKADVLAAALQEQRRGTMASALALPYLTVMEAADAPRIGAALAGRGLVGLGLPYARIREGTDPSNAIVEAALRGADTLVDVDVYQVAIDPADWQAIAEAAAALPNLRSLRMSSPRPTSRRLASASEALNIVKSAQAALDAAVSRGAQIEIRDWVAFSAGGFRPVPRHVTLEELEASTSAHVPVAQSEFENERREKAALQQSLASSDFSQSEAKKAVEALQARVDGLTKEIEGHKKAAKEREAHEQEIRRDLHTRHARDKEAMQQSLDAMTRTQKDLQNEVLALRQNAGRELQAELARAQAEAADAHAQVNRLRAELKAQGGAEAVQELEIANQALQKRVEELQRDVNVAAAGDIARQLQATVNQLQGLKAQLEGENAQLKTSKERADERIRELEAGGGGGGTGAAGAARARKQINDLMAQVSTLETEKAGLEAKLASAGDPGQIDALRAELVAVRKEAAETKAEVATAEAAHKQYVATLDSLLRRYRAVGEPDYVEGLSMQYKKAAEFEVKYKKLMENYDAELERIAQSERELSAQKIKDELEADFKERLKAAVEANDASHAAEKATLKNLVEKAEARYDAQVDELANMKAKLRGM